MSVDYVGRRRAMTVEDWVDLGWTRAQAETFVEHDALPGVPFTEVTKVMLCQDGVTIQPLGHVIRHSPTGFEWGYAGSGPADLALSIMCDHLGLCGRGRFSEVLVDGEGREVEGEPPYQRFKFARVARLPRLGTWQIAGDAVAQFLDDEGYELDEHLVDPDDGEAEDDLEVGSTCAFCGERRPVYRYHRDAPVCEGCWDDRLEATG